MKITATFHTIIAGLFVLLWGYTGLGKTMGFRPFRRAMLNQPFPNEWGEILAIAVPAAELAIAGLLLWKAGRLIGMLASLVLMSAFSTYVGLVWVGTFDYVPCGCAGIFERMGWGTHLAVNLGLMAMAGLGVWSGRTKGLREG